MHFVLHLIYPSARFVYSQVYNALQPPRGPQGEIVEDTGVVHSTHFPLYGASTVTLTRKSNDNEVDHASVIVSAADIYARRTPLHCESPCGCVTQPSVGPTYPQASENPRFPVEMLEVTTDGAGTAARRDAARCVVAQPRFESRAQLPICYTGLHCYALLISAHRSKHHDR